MEDNPKETFFTPLSQHPKWQPHIQNALIDLCALQNLSAKKAIQIMLDFRQEYCQKREQPYSGGKKEKIIDLYMLDKLYPDQLGELLKGLAQFLLEYTPGPIPLLLTGQQVRRQYSKKKLFYLVVLMFMGLVPKQPYDNSRWKGRFHCINEFGHLLSYNQFKTRCVVEYLRDNLPLFFQKQQQNEEFLIYRRNTPQQLGQLLKEVNHKELSNLKVEADQASIELFDGEVKIDFANRFIGGGCLRDGCVQEEIMFAIRPQLYAATLLCEKMEPNESLAMQGFRYYFGYKGYANKTTYNGKVEHPSKPFLQNGCVFYDEKIVAIDALKFNKGDPYQFTWKAINREILKAYTGFCFFKKESRIITGGWGCGAYNGDFITKVIIQWIAASMAGKDIVICPFGRKKSLEQIKFVQTLRKLRVGDLYHLLIQAGQQKEKYNLREGIFDLILDIMRR